MENTSLPFNGSGQSQRKYCHKNHTQVNYSLACWIISTTCDNVTSRLGFHFSDWNFTFCVQLSEDVVNRWHDIWHLSQVVQQITWEKRLANIILSVYYPHSWDPWSHPRLLIPSPFHSVRHSEGKGFIHWQFAELEAFEGAMLNVLLHTKY